MGEEETFAAGSLRLLAAFMAMESTDCLLSLARECGGGSISEKTQSFILEHCIRQCVDKSIVPSNSYIDKFLKKVIIAIESSGHEVVEDLYEQQAYFMNSFKDSSLLQESRKVCKSVTFLFPNGFSRDPSCSKLIIPLQCSLNVLEGDTGCSVWPSSLFLSEFILSYPEFFDSKSCFEIGSGVGLVGITLKHANASQIILSDGDQSSLANLKLNLELNHLKVKTNVDSTAQDLDSVECVYLLWEAAAKSKLQIYKPDIILGADVIYDPACLPSLIQVLSTLLKSDKLTEEAHPDCSLRACCNFERTGNRDLDKHAENTLCGTDQGSTTSTLLPQTESVNDGARRKPVAYIATVIRNVDTFNYFLSLATRAQLSVVDITEARKPLNLLPYMRSYDRSSIRLYNISSL